MQAAGCLWKAYHLLKHQHAQEHRQQLSSAVHNLAVILERQGDIETCEALHIKSLSLRRTLYAAPSLKIAATLGNLAHLYQLAQLPLAAEPMSREALGMVDACAGHDSLEAATYSMSLATTLHELNQVQVRSGRGLPALFCRAMPHVNWYIM